jgi:hypothetical protein
MSTINSKDFKGAKEMQKEHCRSELDSDDLARTAKQAEKLNKSLVSESFVERNKLPSYLETKYEKYGKNEPIDESKIQVLSISMQ